MVCCPLGHGCRDRGDVDRLEILLVQPRARRLTGDAQDRDRIGDGRVEPGDHVGAGGTRCADAHTDIAGRGAGVAFGHVGSALDMAAEDVADRPPLRQSRVERVDRRPRHAEGGGHALLLEHENGGLDRGHPGHRLCLPGTIVGLVKS